MSDAVTGKSDIRNSKSEISLIVAMAENRVIGRDGDLPWRLPADLAHFKRLTTGHTIVMGRKTFESIGRPLPNRRSIVLTRDPQWAHEGVEVVHDWDALQAKVAGEGEVFVIGGEVVFGLALPWADRVYLTLVHATVAGDTFFPELPSEAWQLSADERRPADERNKYAMSFQQYDRR
ncbi:dihydrofolate reductase [Phycisphaerales bacterium AB-hyl4]|uniref:Dihydrofolate reductase n=1 Tax=Natronomicrosphaera hydrolytica TaxID=3242702 RepID=A0ABV4U965_9BACT